MTADPYFVTCMLAWGIESRLERPKFLATKIALGGYFCSIHDKIHFDNLEEVAQILSEYFNNSSIFFYDATKLLAHYRASQPKARSMFIYTNTQDWVVRLS